jgi:hypothetical protein
MGLTNPQKGIWSFTIPDMTNSQTGIDIMNNTSIIKYNTLCSYNISTLPLNKKGILQQHQEGEREASSTTSWNTD